MSTASEIRCGKIKRHKNTILHGDPELVTSCYGLMPLSPHLSHCPPGQDFRFHTSRRLYNFKTFAVLKTLLWGTLSKKRPVARPQQDFSKRMASFSSFMLKNSGSSCWISEKSRKTSNVPLSPGTKGYAGSSKSTVPPGNNASSLWFLTRDLRQCCCHGAITELLGSSEIFQNKVHGN